MAVNVNLYNEYIKQKREHQAQLQKLKGTTNLNAMDKFNVGVKNVQQGVVGGFLKTFEGLGDKALTLLAKGADLLNQDRVSEQLQDIVKFNVSDYLTSNENKLSKTLMGTPLDYIGGNLIAGHNPFGNNKVDYQDVSAQQNVLHPLVQKFTYGAGNVLGNMALMGAGEGAKGASIGAKIASKAGQFGLMASSAGGQQIEQSLNEGKSLNTALLQGAISGSIEGATELASAGFQDVLVKNGIVKGVLGKAIVDTTFEGLEEVASDVAQPLVEMLTDKKGQGYFSVLKEQNGGNWEGVFKNMAEDFGIAFITSALMGGGEVAQKLNNANWSLQTANVIEEMGDISQPLFEMEASIKNALNSGNYNKATALQAKLENYKTKNNVNDKIKALFIKYIDSKGVKLNAQEDAIMKKATDGNTDTLNLSNKEFKQAQKAVKKINMKQDMESQINSYLADSNTQITKENAQEIANKLGVKLNIVEDKTHSSYNENTNTWTFNINTQVQENGSSKFIKNGEKQTLVEGHKALVHSLEHEFGIHALNLKSKNLSNMVYIQAQKDGYITDETYKQYEKRYAKMVEGMSEVDKVDYIKEEISANMINKYFPTMDSFLEALGEKKSTFRQRLANSLSNLFRKHKEQKPAYMSDLIATLRKNNEEYKKALKSQNKAKEKASYTVKEDKEKKINEKDVVRNELTEENVENINNKELETRYDDAIKNNDLDLAQKYLDEYAKRKGYTPTHLYTGSNSNFDTFDIERAGQSNSFASIGFWFTPNEKGALNFANSVWYGDGDANVYDVYLKLDNPKVYKLKKYSVEQETKLINKYNDLRDDARNILNKYYSLIENKDGNKYILRLIFGKVESNVNYANDSSYPMPLFNKELQEDVKFDDVEFEQLKKDILEYKSILKKARNTQIQRENIRYNDSYEQFRTDIYKLAGATPEDANFMGSSKALWRDGKIINNRELAKDYKEKLIAKGYDGIIIKGTRFDNDTLGANNDQYVVFNSNQIKLATTQTFDDNGKIIPLSERFNENKDSIRYDISEDSEGNELSKEQVEHFKKSVVRDEKGNLLIVYHGTKWAGFMKFDPSGSGNGYYRFGDNTVIFFTDDIEMAKSYSNDYDKEAKVLDTAKFTATTLRELNKTLSEYGEQSGYGSENIRVYKGDNIPYQIKRRINKPIESDKYYLTYEEGYGYLGTYDSIDEVIRYGIQSVHDTFGDVDEGENPLNRYIDDGSIYKGYVNIENPLVVDAKGKEWNKIEDVENQYYGVLKDTEKYGENDLTIKDIDTIEKLLSKYNIELFQDDEIDKGYENEYFIGWNDGNEIKIIGVEIDENGISLYGKKQSLNQILQENVVLPTTTNKLVEKALKEGYDGVIIKNVIDYGSSSLHHDNSPHNLYITIKSANQFKDYQNKKPTNNDDIRYEIAEEESFLEEYKDILEQDKLMSSDYYSEEKKKVDSNEILRNLEDLLYNRNIEGEIKFDNKQVILDYLKLIQLQNNPVKISDLVSKVIMKNVYVEVENPDLMRKAKYVDDFKLEFFHKIKIDDDTKSELQYRYGKDYKTVASFLSNNKKDGYAKDTLDQRMSEWKEIYPEYENKGDNASDLFIDLYEQYKNYKNDLKKYNKEEYDEISGQEEYKQAEKRIKDSLIELANNYISFKGDVIVEYQEDFTKINQLKLEIQALEENIKQLQKENKTKTTQKEIDGYKNKITMLKEDLIDTEKAYKGNKSSREKLEKKYNTLKDNFNTNMKELLETSRELVRNEKQTYLDTNALNKLKRDLEGDKKLTTRFRQDIEKVFRDISGNEKFRLENDSYTEIVDMLNNGGTIDDVVDYLIQNIGFEYELNGIKFFDNIESVSNEKELDMIRYTLKEEIKDFYNSSEESLKSKKNRKIDELKSKILAMKKAKSVASQPKVKIKNEKKTTLDDDKVKEMLTKSRDEIIKSTFEDEKTRLETFKNKLEIQKKSISENLIVYWVDAQHAIYKSIMNNESGVQTFLSKNEELSRFEKDYVARYVVQRGRSATARAINMVKNGIISRDGKPLIIDFGDGNIGEVVGIDTIYDGLNFERAGEFEAYLLEKHNVMRMSIYERLAYNKDMEGLTIDEIIDKYGIDYENIPLLNRASMLKKNVDEINDRLYSGEKLSKEEKKALLKLRATFNMQIRELTNQAKYMKNKPIYNSEIDAKTQVENSQKEIARFEKENPDFKQRALNLYAYNEWLLRESISNGRLSEENYDIFKKYYGYTYVPIFRTMNNNQQTGIDTSLSIRGYQHANGGTEKIMAIRESMQILTARSLRANAINNIATMIDNNGMSSEARKQTKDNTTNYSEKETQSVEQFEESLNDDNAVGVLENIDTKTNKDNQLYEMRYFKDGEMQRVKITLNEVVGLQDLQNNKSLTETVDDFPRKALKKIMGGFRSLVTNYSPFFVVRNMFKDAHDAVVYSRYDKYFLKNYAKAFELIREGLFTKKSNTMWKLYTQYGGGESGYFSVRNILDKKKTYDPLKIAGNAIERANLYVEQLPRFAEFLSSVEYQEKMVKEGKLKEVDYSRAIYDSQDITLNFGIHGSGTVAKAFNTYVIPFFNAQIQGSYKATRTFVTNKNVYHRLKATILLAFMGLAPIMANAILYGDDDDYEQLSSYYKDNFYLIKYGDGKFVRLPKGRMQSIFATMLDKDYKTTEKLKSSWDTLSPVSSLRSILEPFKDVQTNTTWYGATLVGREWDGTRPENRYTNDTSYFAKQIGKQFGVAPIKVDYLLDQYTGVFGDFLLPLSSNNGKGKNMGKELVKSQYVADSVFKNNRSAKFYDLRTELQYQTNEGSLQAKAELKYMNKMMNQIRELQEQVEGIKNDNEKRAVQTSINAIYNQATTTAKELRKILDKMDINEENYEDIYYIACASLLGGKGALELMNNEQYERASELDKVGIDYDMYFNYYMDTKGMDKSFKTEYINKMKISKQNKYLLYLASGYSIPATQKQILTTYIKNSKMSDEYKATLTKKLS